MARQACGASAKAGEAGRQRSPEDICAGPARGRYHRSRPRCATGTARAQGQSIRGDRTINQAEAAVVRRIFKDYLADKSSRTIAFELNREGVAGPQGSQWGPSTIHGKPKRGVGILNNELYVVRLVWNRLRYVKDPDTG